MPGAFLLEEEENLKRGWAGESAVSDAFREIMATRWRVGERDGETRSRGHRAFTHPTFTPNCFWYAFSVCRGREARMGEVSGPRRRRFERVESFP